MPVVQPRARQLVDWSAAIWAGLIAGAVFIALNLIVLPMIHGGNAWWMSRLFASPVMKTAILADAEGNPESFNATALLVTLLMAFGLSVLFSLVLNFITHRWGWLTAAIVGALFGVCLYFINLYVLVDLSSAGVHMNFVRTPFFLGTHILFGALVGLIYELMEVEEFVDDQGNPVEPQNA